MNKEKLKFLIEQIVAEELDKKDLLKEGDDVIYKAFIQPFTDIVDTAIHGAKSIATKTGTELVKTVKMVAAGSFLPFVSADELKNIEKQADNRLQQYMKGLDDQYKDVLKRNIDSMNTRDARYFSFFLRPDLFFAKQVATGTPVLALDLLDTLTLGNPKVRALKDRFKDLHQVKDPPGASGGPLGGSGGGGAGGGYADYSLGDGGLEEAVQQKEQQINFKKEIENLLKDPEIIDAMKNNKIIKDLATIQVQTVLDRAENVSNAKTFDDIKKLVGPEASKFEKEMEKNFPQEATDEEKKHLLNQMVPEFKKAYEMIYKNYLTKFLNLDSMFPADIKKAIQKIDKIS